MQCPEQPVHRGEVNIGGGRFLNFEIFRQVGADPRKVLTEKGTFTVVFDFCFDGTLQFIGIRINIFKRPVSIKQRHRGFWTDTGDTGIIIGRIPDESFVIDHLIRHHTEKIFDHLRRVIFGVRKLAAGKGDINVFIHQLQQVTVPGNDFYVIALCRHLFGSGTEHIICLKSFHFQTRYTQRIHQFFHAADLKAQIIRHFGSGTFIGGEKVIPEGLADIKGDCQIIRMVVFQQTKQDRGKTVGTGGWFALRRHPTGGILSAGDRKISAVRDRVAIYKI